MKDTEVTARGALMAALYKMGVYEAWNRHFVRFAARPIGSSIRRIRQNT